MKKVFKVCSFLCLLLTFASVVTYAYPTSYAINVSNQKQAQSNWCWAASSVSILGYYGTQQTQAQFCTRVKGTDINESATDLEVQTGLSSYGVNSTFTDYLSFSSIITQIYNYKRPIYAGWSWKEEGGHALVIIGYESDIDNYVEYMDPLLGDTYVSNYNYFKGGSGYDHVWDGTLYNISR